MVNVWFISWEMSTLWNSNWNPWCGLYSLDMFLFSLSVLYSIVTTSILCELAASIVAKGSLKMKWMKPFIETECNIDVTLFLWLSCWLCHFLCYYAAISLKPLPTYPVTPSSVCWYGDVRNASSGVWAVYKVSRDTFEQFSLIVSCQTDTGTFELLFLRKKKHWHIVA